MTVSLPGNSRDLRRRKGSARSLLEAIDAKEEAPRRERLRAHATSDEVARRRARPQELSARDRFRRVRRDVRPRRSVSKRRVHRESRSDRVRRREGHLPREPADADRAAALVRARLATAPARRERQANRRRRTRTLRARARLCCHSRRSAAALRRPSAPTTARSARSKAASYRKAANSKKSRPSPTPSSPTCTRSKPRRAKSPPSAPARAKPANPAPPNSSPKKTRLTNVPFCHPERSALGARPSRCGYSNGGMTAGGWRLYARNSIRRGCRAAERGRGDALFDEGAVVAVAAVADAGLPIGQRLLQPLISTLGENSPRAIEL